MRKIVESSKSEFVLLFLKTVPITLGQYAIQRMLRIANETSAAMVYADRYSVENGEIMPHPVIDWQEGSLRDDFDFGSAVLINSSVLQKFLSEEESNYKYAGWYELWLFLSRNGSLFHINEFLYTEDETDLRASGVKQFDYVNPANREVQIEMEQVVTSHLDKVGALIDTLYYREPDFAEQDFQYEASVIIPVRNRERTICDAVDSALSQKTNFPFNVIVVDNHSTDNTTALLSKYTNNNGEAPLIHIIPKRTDLGIGGCWNLAIDDKRCGRFAVQLDSDDLYSSPDTLQTIVNAFYEQHAAMIVGSYRMCDFNLNTLPPGLINHAEWTEKNGCNNALRINGLGAPRAFYTPLLRQLHFPNTNYGEDYALGLAFSRMYKIGRIFSELYLCRRWDGNSDAALSVEKVNANNLYKDRLRTMELMARRQLVTDQQNHLPDDSLTMFFNRQLESWDLASRNFRDLQNVLTRNLSDDEISISLQFNPARIVSTGAAMDKSTLSKRPCFLCKDNRPKEQLVKHLDDNFDLLVNPFPILPQHFTIPAHNHIPQSIIDYYPYMQMILAHYPDIMIFYNGPESGASAPDHLHFQAGTSGVLPLQKSWNKLQRDLSPIYSLNEDEEISIINSWFCPALLIRCHSVEGGTELFHRVYDALPKNADSPEPMLNIVSWMDNGQQLSVIFPRGKHRPDCYYADNENNRFIVSPGALDMAGLIITPRKGDFEHLTEKVAIDILREVSLSDNEMQRVVAAIKVSDYPVSDIENYSFNTHEPYVHVGIVCGELIEFSLNGDYEAKGEVINGKQMVSFSEGGILWNGNLYRELTFIPSGNEVSFSLNNVTIGASFHWERQETQTFKGILRIVVEADKICAINILSVEDYLVSVISSEMNATSSLEFLKAHAVISRSWLLAQIERRKRQENRESGFFSFSKNDDELIRWYDRDDHTIFDVCADDHCQRYQGITKATNLHVEQAVRETCGQLLMFDDEICDARFSKCCGGVSEEFQFCWEDSPKPYLSAVRDNNDCSIEIPDLSNEAEAEKWIRSKPDSFCNTDDKKILSQVLNDYDQETSDFYRWTVEYSQQQISTLLCDKLKMDFGEIKDLIPVQRGKSGRIWKLQIVGAKRSFTIGKELEIRRALSESHLYSSAFVVDKFDVKGGIPQRFVLTGAGWGHGVGLCQIGAAVMGEHGYKYNEILAHYYRGAEIKKVYG